MSPLYRRATADAGLPGWSLADRRELAESCRAFLDDCAKAEAESAERTRLAREERKAALAAELAALEDADA